MCQVKSAIILKDSVICPLDTDSHEDMIEQAGLDDTTTMPKFVRVEMTPKDGNIFNHDPDNWQFETDQDYIPDWFDAEDARRRMLPELKRWWAERFVLNAKIDSITTGRWFVGAGGTVRCVQSGGVVQAVWSGGTVLAVLDGGTVHKVLSGGTVLAVLTGGTVHKVQSGGTVHKVLSGGTVERVLSGGTVERVLTGGTVLEVQSGGTVLEVLDGGTVLEVQSGGTVLEVLAGGTAIFWGAPKTRPTIADTGIVIYRHENKIIVADENIELVQFRALEAKL